MNSLKQRHVLHSHRLTGQHSLLIHTQMADSTLGSGQSVSGNRGDDPAGIRHEKGGQAKAGENGQDEQDAEQGRHNHLD
jgi:hypothetical protein